MYLEGSKTLPLVSVIIPTYNYGHFVLSAIESVKSQDYQHLEIIVVDDGSTDGTQSVLVGLAGIVYVRQENQGLPAARNHGIRLAKGKYLQFLDADDLLGGTSIRRRVEFLEENLALSTVICRSAFFQMTPLSERWAFLHKEWRQPDEWGMDLALHFFNVAPVHAFLIRRSAIDEHALVFDESLRACEDYDFWFRLAQTCGAPGMLRSCWVYYRKHKNSMSSAMLNQTRHDAELCRRKFRAIEIIPSGGSVRRLFEYLAAMFAGSVITARRLWKFDPSSFPGFVLSCLIPLQQRLNEESHSVPNSVAVRRYLAIARFVLAKMYFRDRSISSALYERLVGCCLSDRSMRPDSLELAWKNVPALLAYARFLKLLTSCTLVELLSVRPQRRADSGQT